VIPHLFASAEKFSIIYLSLRHNLNVLFYLVNCFKEKRLFPVGETEDNDEK